MPNFKYALDITRERLKRFSLVENLHTFYVILALGGYFIFAVGDEPKATKELFVIAGFILYGIILLVVFIILVITNGRKTRYAEVPRLMHGAMHSSRDSYFYLERYLNNDGNFEVKHMKDLMMKGLNSFALSFSLVAGVRCRASIKVIGAPDGWVPEPGKCEGLYVQTLVRDNSSASESNRLDRDDLKDEITDNSDFYLIAKRKLNAFFCNDLTKYDHYDNSHDELVRKSSVVHKKDKWLLPYKSAIVWPIRYVIGEDEKNIGGVDQALYGFLTIDSYSRDVFKEPTDIDMGAIFADGLYPVLALYRKAKAKAKAEETK